MPHLPTLLAQIAVILLAARSIGWLLRRIHQPQVVGEMAAGVLLGPSLLGWLFPRASEALFPPESLGFLGALSQLGVVLFMFIIGLEANPLLLRGRGRAAAVTANAGILVPFVLGALLGLFLHPSLAPAGVGRAPFAIFLGTAMSITAFPVLARILNDRGLTDTNVGTMALACAAVNDLAGWSILAALVLTMRSDAVGASLGLILLGLAALAGIVLLLVRPILRRVVSIYERRGFLSNDLMAVVLLLLLGCALASEMAGVHALFGAFLLGVVVPRRPGFLKAIVGRTQDLTVVLLLPIFFALTGLKTRVGLLQGAEAWAICGLVLLVAILGKFGGTAAAALLTGFTRREAGALGALMNTRGLVELVILDIGLEIGVISPALFTMMVIMALVTTVMTTPLLELLYARPLTEEEPAPPLLGDAV